VTDSSYQPPTPRKKQEVQKQLYEEEPLEILQSCVMLQRQESEPIQTESAKHISTKDRHQMTCLLL
jgi:hypothetical protein